MLRWIFTLLICLLVNVGSFACNCETNLPKISKEETDKYSLIFTGYIRRLIHQENGDFAEFTVDIPYKGLVPRDIKVSYDNVTSCKMPFYEGDQWLIYARRDSITKIWSVNYCERNRKFPEGDEIDNYTVYSGITLKEELNFLARNYSTGQVVGQDTITMIEDEKKIVIDARRDMDHGTPRQRIILLICSLAGMIIIYFIIRRFLK